MAQAGMNCPNCGVALQPKFTVVAVGDEPPNRAPFDQPTTAPTDTGRTAPAPASPPVYGDQDERDACRGCGKQKKKSYDLCFRCYQQAQSG